MQNLNKLCQIWPGLILKRKKKNWREKIYSEVLSMFWNLERPLSYKFSFWTNYQCILILNLNRKNKIFICYNKISLLICLILRRISSFRMEHLIYIQMDNIFHSCRFLKDIKYLFNWEARKISPFVR